MTDAGSPAEGGERSHLPMVTRCLQKPRHAAKHQLHLHTQILCGIVECPLSRDPRTYPHALRSLLRTARRGPDPSL